MAGRPTKDTVDYFPHYTQAGKTLFIIETQFGNDGYAFWYKLLETLCQSSGLVIMAGNLPDWQYLLARTRVDSMTANAILDALAGLNAIDAELWRGNRAIWVQNLVDNVKTVFDKREKPMPTRPLLQPEMPLLSNIRVQPEAEIPQSRVKYSRVENSIGGSGGESGDSDIIAVWRGVKGWNVKPAATADLLARLKLEFKGLDILAESKAWAAFCLGRPLTAKSKPTSQLWNWCVNSRKYQGTRNGSRAPAPLASTKELAEGWNG